MEGPQFTTPEVDAGIVTLEALVLPGANPESFRLDDRLSVMGPRGLFNLVYFHIVTSMPTDPARLLPHIMTILKLRFADDGTMEFQAGDATYRGDNAVDTAWRRLIRVVYVLQMLLYVNGVMQYDGTFKGGTDLSERWQQISGCCIHIMRALKSFSALRVCQSRDLLSLALNGGRNPTFDLTRLELIDPKRLNRYQRLIVNILKDARQELGGLRKLEGKLFRPKLVPRQERVIDEAGRVMCVSPGCTGHASTIGKRADHVFRAQLRRVEDSTMYSTKASDLVIE